MIKPKGFQGLQFRWISYTAKTIVYYYGAQSKAELRRSQDQPQQLSYMEFDGGKA